MISWKYSFEKISKDLELSRKKKQALDDLFNSGKISAHTYESLDKELINIISEIEARQKGLAEKMTSKIADLESQIGTLEMFLANSEIQYAAGEIDDELHTTESSAFSLGLDAVKRQLAVIKEVVTGLMPEVVAPPPPSPTETDEGAIAEAIIEDTTEEPVEITEEPVGTTVEEATEVETISEATTIDEHLNTQTEDMPTEEVTEDTTEEVAEFPPTEEIETPTEETETPTEETLEEEAPSEEVFEESVMTEIPVEVAEETVTEEEASFDEEETEASTEEPYESY